MLEPRKNGYQYRLESVRQTTAGRSGVRYLRMGFCFLSVLHVTAFVHFDVNLHMGSIQVHHKVVIGMQLVNHMHHGLVIVVVKLETMTIIHRPSSQHQNLPQ